MITGELGNPSSGRGLTGDFRTAAIAKATRTPGPTNFGPSPGTTGSNKPNIYSELEGSRRREERQDAREKAFQRRESGTRGGRARPVPRARPGGNGSYGSNRNYPQTV